MSRSHLWRIGGWLNVIQTIFVGILRVLSVPIVLLLSIASGYTTYYGLSFFITPWIAVVITVAVQSIVVICSLELAGIHWRANPSRYLMVLASLMVALIVSVSFSYFKFYEFSQKDTVVMDRQNELAGKVNGYIEQAVQIKSRLAAEQRQRVAKARDETTQAYTGTYPGMHGNVGRGPMWAYLNEVLIEEQARLTQLENQTRSLETRLAETRSALQAFTTHSGDSGAHDRLTQAFQSLQGETDSLAANHGLPPLPAPRLATHAELSRPVTPTFDMWRHIAWFPLACAAMVDFFTLILSYRLETTAPGPLTESEKDLAFQGLRQFSQFRINGNDELEFVIERSELERARRVSDWQRMFAVALLLNRGYLRKMGKHTVEFAPNLYPIIAERMSRPTEAASAARSANDAPLTAAMQQKFNG